ncbi:MAG: peptidoglycan DD-metalloendopeptidase family protein [Anaerolineales bacterium]|nr:peptidoglycan DD-metalloendopeptidase family protein [Anaerolineales bacterium]
MKPSFVVLTVLFFLVGCRIQPGETIVEAPTAVPATATHSPTATTTLTPTPTATPTATATPIPTPTPTATAVPLTLTGDPRAALLHEPVPSGNAPCGTVDTLDFPLEPPEGDGVRGGQDFGVFRDRYGKFHAGEDWGFRGINGRSAFGTPVYAIGHGFVTYAEPEGWNRDKGVIIIRHTFADGHSFLSFYGHLDPPSFLIQAGDCVQRGQQLANIGKPRTSPHLHFEIREHLAFAPGPGYWAEDPTTVGWLPPSATIWQERMAAQPGVAWQRPFTSPALHPIGQLAPDTLLLREEGQLLTLNVTDGNWQPLPIPADGVSAAQLSNNGRLLCTASGNTLTAFSTADWSPQWEANTGQRGTPQLLPLPDGGVVVATATELAAFGETGQALWRMDLDKRPLSHAQTLTALLLSTADAVWELTATAPQRWLNQGGQLAQAGDQLWLYDEDGVWRVEEEETAVLALPLPRHQTSQTDLTPLPNGGLLLAHADAADRRLIWFNRDGTRRWDRSFAALGRGTPFLLTLADQPYLLYQTSSGSSAALNLYAINPDDATLTHLFSGGTRTSLPQDSWAMALSDQLLIHIGGGALVAFFPVIGNQ